MPPLPFALQWLLEHLQSLSVLSQPRPYAGLLGLEKILSPILNSRLLNLINEAGNILPSPAPQKIADDVAAPGMILSGAGTMPRDSVVRPYGAAGQGKVSLLVAAC